MENQSSPVLPIAWPIVLVCVARASEKWRDEKWNADFSLTNCFVGPAHISVYWMQLHAGFAPPIHVKKPII